VHRARHKRICLDRQVWENQNMGCLLKYPIPLNLI
jgi:hypothetical protein